MAEITSTEVTVAVPIEVSKQSQIASSSSLDDVNERVTQLDQHWLLSMEERLRIEPAIIKASSSSKLCSIHRVPHHVRRHNENAYEPQVISIGPLHYDKRKSQLRAMEEHKWRFLRDIVSRNTEGSLSLKRHLVAVKELEEEARNCYSEVINLDSNSFVEMMVLDGCFIIEWSCRFFDDERNGDPLFDLPWLGKAITADLCLMENQIPFFILQHLFDLVDPIDIPLLKKRVFKFFSGPITEEKIAESNIKIQHPLHLCHTSEILFTQQNYPGPRTFERIPCASELVEAGIKFEKKADVNDTFLNINFEKDKGVIEIPQINVFNARNRILLNLIAFELSYPSCKSYFVAYIAFMDCLINSGKDVEILCQKEIIANDLGNEESVATFFNETGREIMVCSEEFYLSGVCKEINQYRKRAWPKLRTSLLRDYFKNPWTIISFLAALLLLLLTMTQSFFSAFPKFSYGK